MIFIRSRLAFRQFMIACVLASILMIADYRFHLMVDVRYTVEWLLDPLYRVVRLPVKLYQHASFYFKTVDQLRVENTYLKNQSLIHARYLLQAAALKAENSRLRALLYSAENLEASSMIAEVLGALPDPYRQEMTLSKGAQNGVTEGQVVLDYEGMIGQVVHVGPTTSRVLLITDANHVIPVQVNRNGVRALAVGSGEVDKLYLLHISHQADIRTGDLLISSGLDGRFPFGYPVAVITEVFMNTKEHFSRIEAKPLSQLDRIRYVLIVMNQKTSQPSLVIEKN